MGRSLPATLTSYDVLKSVMVAAMIADHIGAFFFPEQMWLKIVGRCSLPTWFFLIGYARGREIGPGMVAGGLALLAGSMVSGQTVFPLNILFTLMAVRLALGPVMRVAALNVVLFWAVAAAAALLIPQSRSLADYGTMGLLFAMFGWLARRQPERRTLAATFIAFCTAVYTSTQWAIFPFTDLQAAAVAAGTGAVLFGLSAFRPAALPRLDAALPAPVRGLAKLFGRRTLLMYVLQILAIEAAAMILNPGQFVFLGWGWSYFPLPFIAP